MGRELVLIDGYGGIFFKEIQHRLQRQFDIHHVTVKWQFTSDYFKSEDEIDTLVAPFIGEKEEVWGKRTSLELKDFLGMTSF